MTIADEARANALSFEAVKYAYRQSKDGIVVSFVVHPSDVPDGLATAPLGARYVAVLVQVGDDEKPVKQSAAAQPERKDSVSTARAKRPWVELQPQQQAGIRCGEEAFRTFLKEEYENEWRESQDAADCVRLICEVQSRVQLGINQKARMLWRALDDKFEAWKRVA